MGKRSPRQRIENVGVSALARETGLSASTISDHMRKGETPDQIRAYAKIRSKAKQEMAEALPPARKQQTASKPDTGEETEEEKTEYEALLRLQGIRDQTEAMKLRRAKALAEGQEITNRQKRSELVPVVYVRHWAIKFLQASRDTLEKGPSELQDKLSLENDPKKCGAILQVWVESVLNKLYELETLWGEGREEEKVA